MAAGGASLSTAACIGAVRREYTSQVEGGSSQSWGGPRRAWLERAGTRAASASERVQGLDLEYGPGHDDEEHIPA